MPNYFFVVGLCGNETAVSEDTAGEIIRRLKEADFKKLMLWEYDTDWQEAKSSREAIEIIKKGYKREGVCYIALFLEEVESFQEQKPLTEWMLY